MSAQWPLVRAWLIRTLPSLTGWERATVFPGMPSTGDQPPQYATVGWVNDGEGGGGWTTVQHTDGINWQEVGTVRSQLNSAGGDADLEPYLAQVIGMSDALEAEIRRDRTLGGTLSRDSTADLDVRLAEVQSTRQGSAASIVLTLSYSTVT